MSPVQPYPAGTIWNYHNLRDATVTRSEEISLSWSPTFCWITDDHTPEETPALDLWKRWVDRVADLLSEEDPTRYQPGDVQIDWTVVDAAEFVPHATRVYLPTHKEDFLTFFSHPVHSETGERLNWARLPVRDKGWSADRTDKGGFIQEVLGWKPSPYQDVMNVHQLAKAAGIA